MNKPLVGTWTLETILAETKKRMVGIFLKPTSINGSLKFIWGNAICVGLKMQAAGTGEDICGTTEGQGPAAGKKSGWIREEEFWKQIKEKEWYGTTHMKL